MFLCFIYLCCFLSLFLLDMDPTEEGGVDVSVNDVQIQSDPGTKDSCVLALDIGTTVIRTYIYDRNVAILGSSNTKVSFLDFVFFLQIFVQLYYMYNYCDVCSLCQEGLEYTDCTTCRGVRHPL